MELGVPREAPVIPTACHTFLLGPLQSSASEDDLWLKRRKQSGKWRSKLFSLLRLSRKKGGEEEEEGSEEEQLEVEWASSSRTSETEPEHWDPDTEVGTLGSHGKGEIGAQRWTL